MNRTRNCRLRLARAFSLIELLVVLAIVALLAGLLLPALCRAKARSHSAVCQHNLKQLGLALQMYVGDYAAYPAMESSEGFWHDYLYPYTTAHWTNALFRCPAYRGRTKALTGGEWPTGSYGYNAFGDTNRSRSLATYGLPSGIPESKVLVPSDMFALGDAHLYRIGDETFHISGLGDIYPLTSPRVWPGVPASVRRLHYHSGQPNFVFCDGHIESIKLDKLNERTPGARRRWNYDHEPHPELWW